MPAARRPGRWPPYVGWVVTMLAAALVVLLLLPSDSSPSGPALGEGELPEPADRAMLPWPGRGPWAADQQFVIEAASAWRDAASSDPDVEAPGDEVVALWAGPVLEARMAVLQSVGPDGAVRLAHVSDMLYGWLQPRLRLLASDRVESEPAFLTFPFVGPDDRRGQLDPDVLATFQMLPGPRLRDGEHEAYRLAGSRLVPVPLQEDGLSEPWSYGRWWQRQDPEIAVLTHADDGALVSVVRLDPDRLLPATPPVKIVDPVWGTERPPEPNDYVVAAAALESAGSSTGEAAVLGSAATPVGQAFLVQVEPTGDDGPSTVAVVASDGSLEASRSRRLDTEAQVAIGAVRLVQGEIVVVAAASPQTSLLTIDGEEDVVTTGDRARATVIPPDQHVSTLEARAFRGEDGELAGATIDVSRIPYLQEP